jgi:polyhydroxyalkanoate synthesis regulator phasin
MTMIELLKKTVLTGIGVAALAKESVEELGRELIEKGKMSEQEGEKFVQELLNRAEESRASLKRQTEKVVESSLAGMHLAKTADIEELRGEIAALRREIEALRQERP